MRDELLLHSRTRSQYNKLLANPAHAILITGITGSGKQTLSHVLAADLLKVSPDEIIKNPYFFEVSSANDTIPIEEIRNLQQFLKLKVPGKSEGINRVILIPRAERMRSEAQNALLKTLEEPPEDTCIILTAEGTEVLLSTITSRATNLAIMPVARAQAEDFYANRGKKSSEIAKFYALSQGQAGLLNALLNEESHPLLEQIEIAKTILSEKPGARLYRTDLLAKDKETVKLLLSALQRISHAALQSSAYKQNEKAVKHWNNSLELALKTSKNLKYNANTKLLLDNLFLSL